MAPEKDLELSTFRTAQATRVSGGKVYATDTVFTASHTKIMKQKSNIAIAVNGLLTWSTVLDSMKQKMAQKSRVFGCMIGSMGVLSKPLSLVNPEK